MKSSPHTAGSGANAGSGRDASRPGADAEKTQYVYILRCADGSLYTGWTNDLSARVAAHNAGKGAKYTRSRRPVELVYYETYTDKGQALSRESAVKKLTRAQKLALIAGKRESDKL